MIGNPFSSIMADTAALMAVTKEMYGDTNATEVRSNPGHFIMKIFFGR